MNHEENIRKTDASILRQCHERGYCCIVDVYMDIGWLSQKGYEDWRRCRVPYLERVCNTSLPKLSKAMKEYHRFALANDYKASVIQYRGWGKGHQKTILRFSKSGMEAVENLYRTNYIDKKRSDELKEIKEAQQMKEETADTSSSEE